jgi:hypothetical protein
MAHLIHAPDKDKPEINGAELIGAMHARSKSRLEKLLRFYRHHYTDAEIVQAMAASPRLVDAIGRGRQ